MMTPRQIPVVYGWGSDLAERKGYVQIDHCPSASVTRWGIRELGGVLSKSQRLSRRTKHPLPRVAVHTTASTSSSRALLVLSPFVRARVTGSHDRQMRERNVCVCVITFNDGPPIPRGEPAAGVTRSSPVPTKFKGSRLRLARSSSSSIIIIVSSLTIIVSSVGVRSHRTHPGWRPPPRNVSGRQSHGSSLHAHDPAWPTCANEVHL